MLYNYIYRPIAILLLATFSLSYSWAQIPSTTDNLNPLSATAQLAPIEVEPGQAAKLVFEVSLPPEFRAYSDQFHINILEPYPMNIGKLTIENEFEFFDKFSKKNKLGIEGSAKLIWSVEVPQHVKPGRRNIELELTYQACTDKFCLFPKKIEMKVPYTVKGSAQDGSLGPSTFEGLKLLSLDEARQKGLIYTFIFVFIAGVLTSLTPCIFPMIPITLAVLNRETKNRSQLGSFLKSSTYVLGIASTYSILGIVATLSGSLFGSSLSSPWVQGFFAFVFFAMALSILGAYEVKTPQAIQRYFNSHHVGKGFVGTFLYGLVAGLIASPCVGPVLVAILSYVAQTRDLFLGFSLLFVYAIGFGQLFILLGSFHQFGKFMPKSGPWLNLVKFLFGLTFLAAGLYYLSLAVETRWVQASSGLIMILVASYYGAFEPNEKLSPLSRLQKGLMVAVLFIGIGFLAQGIWNAQNFNPFNSEANKNSPSSKMPWNSYSELALDNAKAAQRPVIIDFYADWCLACKELESFTFSNPQILDYAKNFEMLKFDATKDSAELKSLRQKYNILGLPTIVFIDSSGVWLKELTLYEFENAEKFLERMKRANKQ